MTPLTEQFIVRCMVQRVLTLESRIGAMGRLGRALADPTRSRILLALAEGPRYPSDLASDLGVSRPNVSNHLGCLRGCGLVVAAYEGRQVRYELASAGIRDLLDQLFALDLVVDPDCP